MLNSVYALYAALDAFHIPIWNITLLSTNNNCGVEVETIHIYMNIILKGIAHHDK